MSHLRLIRTAIAVITIAIGAPLAAQERASSPLETVDAPLATRAVAPGATQSRESSADTLALDSTGHSSVAVQAPVALQAMVTASPSPVPFQRSRSSRSVAMMVVGGAALIVGSVVGGDSGTIIMVGGGVVGLIGLWNYLQ